MSAGFVLAAAALLLAGCTCHNRMVNRADRIGVTVTPQVLVVKGQHITADVTVTFPPRFVSRTTVLRVTPVLEFEGGSIDGTPKFVQGERIRDNYTVISRRNGGSYTQTVTFPYDPRADISTLRLVIEAKCGCEQDEFVPIASRIVAQGVSHIARNADWTEFLEMMPHNFRRVTTNTYTADLMYLINSAQVRNVALSAEQIRLFEEFVRDAEKDARTTLASVQSRGYASPDGPERFNEDLSRRRSETARTAVGQQIRRQGINVDIDPSYYGEDWDGFRELIEASNIPDRNLIVSVLNMYSSSVQREQQIRNMSQVFNVLKTDILPKLRRSQLVANADIQGRTDAELREAVARQAHVLSADELLFAATLFPHNEAVGVYRTAAERFNNDARALNNLGVALAKDGNLGEAVRMFQAASRISQAPEISNNLGVMALVEGNTAEARRFISGLTGERARANQGLIALVEGDYATASRNLTGHNLAVAELANGNLAASRAALGNLDTAQADYVRAIIAMREGNPTTALSSLNSAFGKDPSLRDRARRDIEFYTIRDRF